ncbi:pyridoxine 5'-phosphate oxidase C-terminal domain-containing protein [Streptomyces sp. NPDC101234]
MEFWCADPDRLHRRLRYDRRNDGWHAGRLQPWRRRACEALEP